MYTARYTQQWYARLSPRKRRWPTLTACSTWRCTCISLSNVVTQEIVRKFGQLTCAHYDEPVLFLLGERLLLVITALACDPCLPSCSSTCCRAFSALHAIGRMINMQKGQAKLHLGAPLEHWYCFTLPYVPL